METFLIKNNGNKNIVLDFNDVPVMRPNQEMDLLEYVTEEDIKRSKTLKILLDQGFIEHIKEEEIKEEIEEETEAYIPIEFEMGINDDDDDNDDDIMKYILDENGKLFIEYMPDEVIKKLDNIQRKIIQLKKTKTKQSSENKPVCMTLNFQNIDSRNYPKQIIEEIKRIKETYGFTVKNIVLEFQEE